MTVPRALAYAAGAVAWNNLVLPALRLGPWGRTTTNGAFAAGTVVAALRGGFGARDLGWTRPISGLRWGTAAAAVPLVAYAAALAVPAGRRRLAAGEPRTDHLTWMTVHIPVGTVAAEELVFRSVLHAATQRTDGVDPRWGRVLGAVAFGLWHVAPARAAGDSIPGTVVLTALSGVVFDELRRRSGSVLAPALLHLAVNVGGAAAVGLARTVRVREHGTS